MNVEKKEMLYEGKAKKMFLTSDPDVIWIEYKDDATAFDGKKKGTIIGKGHLNNEISSIFFTMLKEHGVKNHFAFGSYCAKCCRRFSCQTPWSPRRHGIEKNRSGVLL